MENLKPWAKDLAKASKVGFWVGSEQKEVGGSPGAR